MKKMKKLKILMVGTLVLLLTACDLGLQESFDFNPELTITDPFAEITAWEFITTIGSELVTNDDGEEVLFNEGFNYLAAAIRKADYVDFYNQTMTTNRTYLLLNNNAFTGGGDVIQLATGSASTNITEIVDGEEITRLATPDEIMERVDTPEKLERLRTILKYHIVDEYVAQRPTLFTFGIWFEFQTLIPGADGRIAFLRDELDRININGRAPNANPPYPDSPLPATAVSQRENVRNHNYIFNNGIGHTISDPVRNRPY